MADQSTAHTVLLTGVRGLIACDSGEVVAGIVDFVLSQHAGLRVLSRALHERTARRSAIAVIAAERAAVLPRGPHQRATGAPSWRRGGRTNAAPSRI